MRTLDSVDSGSNYNFGDKLDIGRNPRSAFDLSHLNTLTVDNAGKIFPVMCLETVPSDSFDLNVNALLRVLPQVVPLYSRQRVYFHAFYCRNSDLWQGWNAYMKKGKDGNYTLTRPALTADNISSDGLDDDGLVEAGSIWDYMGIPIGTDLAQLISDGYHIDAMPFMALQNIRRWYYVNRNLYISDDCLFPHDDADFRLNNAGNIISYVNESQSNNILGADMWHLWPQDYFTSALPFQQRGDAPTLPLTFGADSSMNLDFSDAFTSSQSLPTSSLSNFTLSRDGSSSESGTNMLLDSYTSSSSYTFNLQTALEKGKVDFSNTTFDTGLVLDDIRRLAVAQLELEKMAFTDGSYEEFGLAFYGLTPKNAVDYKPVYIGGCYQDVSFSEVLQTSSSTDSSALGAYAGHGVSVTNNGQLGHVDCDDYGYIIIMCSIMPDVYYCQGLDRMYTKSIQSEEFLPNRTKLGLRAILNQELFLSGDLDTDQDLFAYQDPFDELRYHQNVIHGKIADFSNESFMVYTQARNLETTPTYSEDFLVASDVRKDYLAAPSEVAYTMQIRFGVRAVRPLPYQSKPAEIIN